MAYYGVQRQYGGGGLGGVFKILTRTIFPAIMKSSKTFLKKQAIKNIPHIANAGIGLVSDINKKRNFKQAVKARGKRLASDVIGGVLSSVPPAKRQKRINRRAVNTSQKKNSRNKHNKPKRTRDIFL